MCLRSTILHTHLNINSLGSTILRYQSKEPTSYIGIVKVDEIKRYSNCKVSKVMDQNSEVRTVKNLKERKKIKEHNIGAIN